MRQPQAFLANNKGAGDCRERLSKRLRERLREFEGFAGLTRSGRVRDTFVCGVRMGYTMSFRCWRRTCLYATDDRRKEN